MHEPKQRHAIWNGSGYIGVVTLSNQQQNTRLQQLDEQGPSSPGNWIIDRMTLCDSSKVTPIQRLSSTKAPLTPTHLKGAPPNSQAKERKKPHNHISTILQ